MRDKHSFRHPVEFPAGAFDLALRLLLLCGVHLRQSFGEPAAGTPQDGKRHFQIALDLCGKQGDAEGETAYLGNLYEIHRYLGQTVEAATSCDGGWPITCA